MIKPKKEQLKMLYEKPIYILVFGDRFGRFRIPVEWSPYGELEVALDSNEHENAWICVA